MSKKRKTVFITLLLIAAACAVFVIVYFVRTKLNSSIYDKMKDEAYSKAPESAASEDTSSAGESESSKAVSRETDSSEPSSAVASTASAVQTSSSADASIDFSALTAQYPDLVGWIKVDDCVIDYPIMQSKVNNSYYLNHTPDGTEGHPASIFMENYNTKDFTDYNTVIYGHNLTAEGTMFACLQNYMDMDYLMQHQYVYIYLPGKTLIYQVFAALTYDDRDIMTNFDFTTQEGRQKFLDSADAARTMDSPWRDDVEVNSDSHIITLSTCIDGYPANRRNVLAVLTNPEALNTAEGSTS